jgi:hypothetical protein
VGHYLSQGKWTRTDSRLGLLTQYAPATSVTKSPDNVTLSHMMSHIAYLRMTSRTIFLDSFALRLVFRTNIYLDSNPHNQDPPSHRNGVPPHHL